MDSSEITKRTIEQEKRLRADLELNQNVVVANDTWEQMTDLHELLQKSRPSERSELSRHYAVAITELEKVMAYYHTFVCET